MDIFGELVFTLPQWMTIRKRSAWIACGIRSDHCDSWSHSPILFHISIMNLFSNNTKSILSLCFIWKKLLWGHLSMYILHDYGYNFKCYFSLILDTHRHSVKIYTSTRPGYTRNLSNLQNNLLPDLSALMWTQVVLNLQTAVITDGRWMGLKITPDRFYISIALSFLSILILCP